MRQVIGLLIAAVSGVGVVVVCILEIRRRLALRRLNRMIADCEKRRP